MSFSIFFWLCSHQAQQHFAARAAGMGTAQLPSNSSWAASASGCSRAFGTSISDTSTSPMLFKSEIETSQVISLPGYLNQFYVEGKGRLGCTDSLTKGRRKSWGSQHEEHFTQDIPCVYFRPNPPGLVRIHSRRRC